MVGLIAQTHWGTSVLGVDYRFHDATLVERADGYTLTLMSRDNGTLHSYALDAGGSSPVSLDQDSFFGFSTPPVGIESHTIGDTTHIILQGWEAATGLNHTMDADGQLTRGTSAGSDTTGMIMTASELVTTGGVARLVGAQAGGEVLTSYDIDKDGTLASIATFDLPGEYVTAIDSLNVGGNDFVIFGSLPSNSITLLAIDSNGGMEQTDSIYAAQGLGLSQITDIVTVTQNGADYAIVAASGSSSLSVLKIDAGGEMHVIDHVIDTRDTRFAEVNNIEEITINDVVFILATGADEGVSVFSLLPDGTLAHRAAIPDTASLGLCNVSSMSLIADGDTLRVIATSEREAGVCLLSLSTNTDSGTLRAPDQGGAVSGNNGDNSIWGSNQADSITSGGGDDYIYDGAGEDTITTGTGADVIVLVQDDTRDTIADFNPLTDCIDMSGFEMLRSTGQLDYRQTATGGIITYLDEELVIQSYNGMGISHDIMMSRIDLDLPHYSPELGAAPSPDDNGPNPNDNHPDPVDEVGKTVNGTAGDDTFIAQEGKSSFEGGQGLDIVDYSTLNQRVVVDLMNTSSNADGAKDHHYTDVEGIIGTPFRDTLIGDDNDNLIDGRSDNDLIHGNHGHDQIFGGDGNDTIYGNKGGDHIEGGGGNDRVYGGWGWDKLYGGDGDDQLMGGRGSDTLRGETGDDILKGGPLEDKLFGDDGNDTLRGGSGGDRLYGGDGDDFLMSGADDDILFGGNGNDRIYGGNGADNLTGGSGNDILDGGNGYDVINGGDGDDTMFGDYGNDVMYGGNGNDVMDGGIGHDTMSGGAGDDEIHGYNGTDVLNGDAGDDSLFGDGGNDRLDGGEGNDELTGGNGQDTFIFNDGHDTITDFSHSNDTIELDSALWNNRGMNAQKLVNTYGGQNGADYVLDFGDGNSLTLLDFNDEGALIDALIF